MDLRKMMVTLLLTLCLVISSCGYQIMPDGDSLAVGVKRRGQDGSYVGVAARGDRNFGPNYPGHNMFMKQLINYLDYVGKKK